MAQALDTHDQVKAAAHFGRRIDALDGVRGVAAIMVLLHHALLVLPDFANYQWYGTTPENLSFGKFLLLRTPLRLVWAGQERAILFFVLSGFVLSLPWLSGKPQSYGRFLLGRLCRIYPPYLVAMALAAIGSIFLGGRELSNASVYYNTLGWAGRPSWAALPSILAVLTNHHSQYMNEAVWSLTWEVRVAIIFPLLIVPIVRWRNLGVALVYAALFVAEYAARHFAARAQSDLIGIFGDGCRYTDYFVLGAGIAMNRVAIGSWFARRHAIHGWLCLIAGLLICWAPWPRLHDEIVGVGAGVIIIAILGNATLQHWLAGTLWLWLGRQSYSLYLIHVPIVMIMVVIFHGQVPIVACLAVIPIAIALAELFHLRVELPSVALAQRLTGYKRKSEISGSHGKP